MHQSALYALCALGLVLLTGGCAASEIQDPLAGTWSASVELPGGALPFSIEVERDTNAYRAFVVNGEERVPVEHVRLEGDSLLLRFEAFNNQIEASVNAGRMAGTLTLIKRYGETQTLRFSGERNAGSRFSSGNGHAARVEGTWDVAFLEDDGTRTEAVGDFRAVRDQVFGTFLTTTGDYRYLAGNVVGDSLFLSTFDGAHAFLFKAAIKKDGTLDGDFWSGTHWHETWTAVRNDNATLPDPNSLTFLKAGYDRFAFSFPDVGGNMVALSDERFAGKVIVVALAGSWCPNCHDEARFLAPYYRDNRAAGLEVIGLMYEHLEDFRDAARQVNHFREKFDVEYTLLVAGISDKQTAAASLPALSHVLAFPTTIFIDRSGNVRRIHTGFTGPGTGKHYDKLTSDFDSLVSQLLAEGQ